MAQVKPILTESMTKYQIGAQQGHRAQEHIFTLKSVIALYVSLGCAVIIQFYDVAKFFDRENLQDGMDALYNYGIKGKLYRLLYNLNKDTKIKVKTTLDTSEEAETGENIGQGTNEGAIMSAASIDYSVNQFFRSSTNEISYAGERLQPLIFQDDICRLSLSVESAQSGNEKLESIIESKLLDFNVEKSVFLVMGPKNAKKQLTNELKKKPLNLCNQQQKISTSEKYLGDMIDSNGLAQSVHATVLKRKGQVVKSIIECRAVIDDFRASTIGGIVTGMEIWELAIIPFLMYNCETWTEIDKSTMDMLNSMQFMFLRYLLATPKTCPIPALLWETGTLLMEHRVAMKKLTFYHHLRSLPPSALAFQISEIQSSLGLPGLVQECKELLTKYNIPDATSEYTKNRWKNLVKRKVKQVNRNVILDMTRKYKKLSFEELSLESFEMKDYLRNMNLVDARLKFSIRAKMTTSVMMNYKGMAEFKKVGWKCQECDEPDTQEHILICPQFEHIRRDKILSYDNDLVDYFRKVISIRGSPEQLVF